MIEDGLFKKFPVESVYGMHNIPGMPVGTFAIRPGPIMASCDIFEITLKGLVHMLRCQISSRDVIVASANLVSALQTIASRTINPFDAAVISVPDTFGAIPGTSFLKRL